MAGLNLLQRLSGVRPATGAADPLRPWDDDGLRKVTTQVQHALRRDCPGLLNPVQVTAAQQLELLSRIQSYLAGDPSLCLPGLPTATLAQMIFDYVAGLGPVGVLLARDDVSEVMVNRHDDIWIEVNGRLQQVAGLAFRDDTHVFYVAQRVLAPLGLEFSAAKPLAEGRLPGSIRVAASMPPAGANTTLSIRKPAMEQLTTADYVRRGTATAEMLGLLQAVVRGRANLLIAGPTGTGKSTLLRYLGSYFDPAARVVVLEQTAELGLEQRHPHVLSLEARGQAGDAGPDGLGPSLADLLRHTLHRRPDYIVVGEVLGAEALQLLMAMATGHPGACTVHAESPARLFDRLSLAMLQARLQIGHQDLLRYLAEAVDVVAYIERMADGSRKISMICEVEGFQGRSPVLRSLYKFTPALVTPELVEGSFSPEQPPSARLQAKLARWGVLL